MIRNEIRKRRNHYDVTDSIQISNPVEVCKAVSALLEKTFPGIVLDDVRQAYDTFTRLYAGTLPGYLGCDTWYHDAQHSLDCSLAMARLLDGYERSVSKAEQLGERRARLGVIIALFHDAGYIRRSDDAARNGAEFTLNHVRRSGEFLAEFLPTVGFADQVELTRHVVHFTGYEIALDQIQVRPTKDRMLGFLLGTADVLAQTADRCYLEKCRDYLFREFEICGMAGTGIPDGPRVLYPTVKSLLDGTPDFNRSLWEERLDGYFGGVHRYLDVHFGGSNPYVEQIRDHLDTVRRVGKSGHYEQLDRRPQAIGAAELRRIAGIKEPAGPKSANKPRAVYSRAA